MQHAYEKLLKHRHLIIVLFLVASVLGLFVSQKVKINYNLIDYLPEEAPSTMAIDVMDESYEKSVPNVRVMVYPVTIPEALNYKEQIEELPGVSDINWLDDIMDVTIPLEVQDQKTVEDWYKDNHAVFSLVVEEENRGETLDTIQEIIGPEGAMSGLPVDSINLQRSSAVEMKKMMSIIIPLMLLILLFTSTAWIDPLLFLINVGVAIALNMGTNVFFGEISFITHTTSAILQLACSMDYAIFLLDRFAEVKKDVANPKEAMAIAATSSVSSILASGSTTVVGFLALAIMQFTIGKDMGFVLAKGIFFSLLSTLVFLPCLAVGATKIIDKTSHRSFMPSFRGLGKFADKTKTIVAVLVALLLVPCYLAQSNISFIYGMDNIAEEGSKVQLDKAKIDETFGRSQSFALMVPMESLAKEKVLGEEIKNLDEVSTFASYAETVGTTIPVEIVPEDKIELLNSDELTRMVIMAHVPPESPETFGFVEKIRDLAEKYYGDSYYLAGEATSVYDMKETIQADSVKVNFVSISGIAIVLLLTFRSISLPILLLLTIESSIFINVAVPYFQGIELNYIGHLIISSIQLGATVDYAILYTNRYVENRRTMLKHESVAQTICDTAGSILTSGGILTAAGLVLGLVSTNTVVSQLGILVARGAALSALLVVILLPALLSWFDPLIQKTSYKMKFLKPEKKQKIKTNAKETFSS